jgi:hypothetical protein
MRRTGATDRKTTNESHYETREKRERDSGFILNPGFWVLAAGLLHEDRIAFSKAGKT